MVTKRKRVRGKYKRLERITELAEEIFEDQFNEDTAPADIGDVIELLCLVVDQLKEMEEFKRT
jgi:hypothetical protein